MSWAIYNGRVRYLTVEFPSELDAKKEMDDLLRPYPPGHEWRRRLSVGVWPPPQKPEVRLDPPYGYVRDQNRHGSFLRPYEYEQRILRELKKLEGLDPLSAAGKLNGMGYHTRDRKKFTMQYVARLRKELV